MKRFLLMLLFGLVAAAPATLVAAPDESQRQATFQAHEAKRKLAAARAAQGTERQRLMREHMQMMNDMMKQMQAAKPAADLSPARLREWVDEHLKLMNELMGQMMEQHHLIMDGATAAAPR
ncbi:MAG: hypothetical protein MUC34_00090 [Anaerolineae bacterium]|jgi:gas vesicle protein|nr:hypothetical protein [Anaerolineae bacterium]